MNKTPEVLSQASATRRQVKWWPLLVAIGVSLVALLAAHHVLSSRRGAESQAAFERQAHRLHERLGERIRTYDEILKGGAGLFASSDDVTRDEWHIYISALQLDEDHIGVQGMGYAPLLRKESVPGHEQAMRTEGFAAYEVQPAGERPLKAPILYIEPLHGRNKLALGYDMYSDPVRREAMDRARDSGQIAYSGRVKLVQETKVDVQAGTLAYLPVYEGGALPASVEQRRARIKGWVKATFRMADLLDAVFHKDLQRVHVRLVDLGTSDRVERTVMFDSFGEPQEGHAMADDGRELTLNLPVHGRRWEITYHPVPGAWPALDQGGYVAGMLATLVGGVLLCALAWSMITTQTRAQEMAHRLTAKVAESEERFRLMVEGVKDYAVLMLDPQGYVQSWNAGARRIKGYEAQEVIGKHFSCFYTAQDVANEVPQHALATALVSGQYKGEGMRVRKDGTLFRAAVLITALRDEQGQVKGYTKVTRDITEQYDQQERLKLWGTVFGSTQEGVAITDVHAKVLAVNPAFERISEYSEAELLGQNLRLLASGRHDREFFRTFWAELMETGFWQGEIWNRRKRGEVHPGWLAVSVVKDADGRITNYVSVYTDITRIPQAQAHIDRLAHHDALTDLPNRVLLNSRLEHTLERSRRGGKTCAVMYMDLDKFKPVNDQLGHGAGDELLKGVAQRLRMNLRENDTVARIGGDEFVVVLEDLSSPEGAEVVAQSIIARLSQPFDLGEGREVQIGCSIGIALYPNHGADNETLLRHADAALYASKRGGRGRATFYVTDGEASDHAARQAAKAGEAFHPVI